MKTLYTILLCGVMCAATMSANAQTWDCGYNITATLDNGVLTISGTGYMEYYSFYNAPWYSLRLAISRVVIEDGVTSINGFFDCSSLTTVEIPNSVTSIRELAFLNCSSLTAVEIPNSVTSIGSKAFSACSSLTTVKIPNSVTSIGHTAFYDCSNLTAVTIGSGVTSIGSGAFSDCSSLTAVEIPNSVTSIGSGAFSGCSSLTAINVATSNLNYSSDNGALLDKNKTLLIQYPAGKTGTYAIPASVIIINGDAFHGCFGLTAVEISNVTSIIEGTFSDCSSLTAVTIGSGVTTIGSNAFSYCSNLTAITIGSGITTIGNNAFSGCSSLTAVEIPNSVTSIGSGAFSGCSSLTAVTIGSGVTTIGNNTFSGCSGLTVVEIPNSVTTIGRNAFSYCSNLTAITIGSGVTTIGDYVFYGCSGLTAVEIPNSVKTIGDYAFDYCNSLTAINVATDNPNHSSAEGVLFNKDKTTLIRYATAKPQTSYTIPNSVTTIKGRAFGGCTSLTTVTIPSLVTTIEDWAFEGCTSLWTAINHAEIPQAIRPEVFSSANMTMLYVPVSSVEAYQAAEVWKYFRYILPIGKSFTITCNNPANGTLAVTANGETVASGDEIEENTVLIITTTPAEGYKLETLQVNGVNVTSGSIYTVVADVEIECTFIEDAGIPVTDVTLNIVEMTLLMDTQITLTATVTPAEANHEVTWSSSNPIVTTVDGKGHVTGIAAGTSVITATASDGVKKASCTVKVISGTGTIEGTVASNMQENLLLRIILYIREGSWMWSIMKKVAVPDDYIRVADTFVDANGHYRFDNLPEGDYIVVVETEGYESVPTAPISLADGETADDVNFTLKGNTVIPDDSITGVDETFAPNLKVYPNPFTDAVRITGTDVWVGCAASLRVINSTGVVVHTQLITSPDEVIHLEHLPAGVYFLRIAKKGKTKIVKMMKQ